MRSLRLGMASDPWLKHTPISSARYFSCEPAEHVRPPDLQHPAWRETDIPTTIASAMHSSDAFPWHQEGLLDEQDHWFHLVLDCTNLDKKGEHEIAFAGLATETEIWLENELVLQTHNMFREYRINLDGSANQENLDCFVRVVALQSTLNQKKPRARWRTTFAAHKNLRFVRTSLLGRTPGIGPAWPIVGPWRPIAQLSRSSAAPRIEDLSVKVHVNDSGTGEVALELKLAQVVAEDLGDFRVVVGEHSTQLECHGLVSGVCVLQGSLSIDRPRLWWPHTHGKPELYTTMITGSYRAEHVEIELQPIGFRTIEHPADGGFVVNGTSVFCRGACWMPLDYPHLKSTEEDYRRFIESVCQAGMNMIRISGDTIYEDSRFYDLCDELGVLVWQDFMFARMDYPFDVTEFHREVTAEVDQQLRRLGHRCSLAVLCGGTEVMQTAAMMGLDESSWHNSWYLDELAEQCRQHRPDVCYLTNSPQGGVMPFHPNQGVSHCFSVGAYKRPLLDAFVTEPVFASESLAFGLAGRSTLRKREDLPLVRDAGANWSFRDVTEHYVAELYGDDALQYADGNVERFDLISQVAVGEVMSSVLSTWRRNDSRCKGALIWTMKDLWPSVGWGLADSAGEWKAPYYFLKRVLQPVALNFVHRGLNGLTILISNDSAEPIEVQLGVKLMRRNGVQIASGEIATDVPARQQREIAIESIIGTFVDSDYAYRFGAAEFDVVVAEATLSGGREGALQALSLRENLGLLPSEDIAIHCTLAEVSSSNGLSMELQSEKLVQGVYLDMPGYRLTDNFFHLVPGLTKRIQLTRRSDQATSNNVGVLRALNMANELPLKQVLQDAELLGA